jgi:hypothetical protein
VALQIIHPLVIAHRLAGGHHSAERTKLELHMSDTSNPNQSQSNDENGPNEKANPQSSAQQGRCVLEPLCSAVSEGAHRAKAAAERAVPKVRASLSSATYWLGYGVSFAAVFSYVIVKELAPEVFKAGCRDGAQAGQETAENLASKLQARSDAPGEASSPGAEPSGGAAQPGVA